MEKIWFLMIGSVLKFIEVYFIYVFRIFDVEKELVWLIFYFLINFFIYFYI